MTNQQIINAAQTISYAEEKASWAKFEAVRDAKYSGKGSRAIKAAAVDAARIVLKAETKATDDKYAKAVDVIYA